jgi:hypothetical protein
LTHSKATLVPSGEIRGSNGPWYLLTGPACGTPSLTTVTEIGEHIAGARELVQALAGGERDISPVSACET